MADNSGIYDILGANMTSATGSQRELSGNLNIRRSKQRALYDRLLKGEAYRREVGERSSSYNQLATSPSWTQSSIGKRHAYVIGELSSSAHETFSLNTFNSGTQALETGPVPASASAYYSKQSRFVKLTYKLSASALLPITPSGAYIYDPGPFPYWALSGPNIIMVDTTRPAFVATSGSYRRAPIYDPAVFEINVPDYGKIRDVRVWVEFIHDWRLGPDGTFVDASGNLHSFATSRTQGLSSCVVALRSPNVTFEFSHPLQNNPRNRTFNARPGERTTGALTGTNNQFGGKFYRTPEIFKNSFILWHGDKALYEGFFYDTALNDMTGTSWDSDIDMRTVFSDASPYSPPHHLNRLYGAATQTTPGLPTSYRHVLTASAPSDNILKVDPATPNRYSTHSVCSITGANIPWFLDLRLPSGSVKHSALLCYYQPTNSLLYGTCPERITGSSPPPGWLTGPGGVAAVNEFPTTGSNIGVSSIKPYYPLLDDVYQKFVYVSPSSSDFATEDKPNASFGSIGFRPGLRGSEIHGKWQLLIGMTSDMYTDSNGVELGMQATDERTGIWFRQFRVEFLVDTGVGQASSLPSKQRRFTRSTHVPRLPGKRMRLITSGTFAWFPGLTYIYDTIPDEYGRSFGIVDTTGSNASDFAVFSRITGSLLENVTGSSQTNLLNAFIHNEFGTPYIPLSSGSSVSPSFFSFDEDEARAARALRDEVLRPRTVVSSAQSVRNVLNRNRFIRSARDQVVQRLSALGLYGNASGSSVPT